VLLPNLADLEGERISELVLNGEFSTVSDKSAARKWLIELKIPGFGMGGDRIAR